jgi:hypothetical protein
MAECFDNNPRCRNLILKTAQSGQYIGKQFFGCRRFLDCNYFISLHFDASAMSFEQQRLVEAFRNFVGSNMFLLATFGMVYFNLRNAAFLDYLLRSDIVRNEPNVSYGITGAKLFSELFNYLFLIPDDNIKRYLINNFPDAYNELPRVPYPTIVGIIDYENIIVDESVIEQYKDINTYDR